MSLNEKFRVFKERHQQRAPGIWNRVNASDDEILARTVRSLNDYFNGSCPLPLDIPLDLVGTPFQVKLWKALLKIPFGETSSYAQIARKIGSPKAARAVGGACGANPLPLFIPCHRVVETNGGLGGFGGGLQRKKQLLKLERI